jgi:AcrR family transcriptional regulator
MALQPRYEGLFSLRIRFMTAAPPSHLNPRKRPRQARATATLEAIFEATIQLLLSDGLHLLTTTRVAQRAGVSVGTMYQYFPHKQALLYALNERYLVALSTRIEAMCLECRGQPIEVMIETLIDTYWSAKTERADVTRALYRTAVELDNEALIEAFAARVDAATTAMLANATDAEFRDPGSVSLALVTVIFGAVRHAFERNLTPTEVRDLQGQVALMCRAYVQTVPTLGPAALKEGADRPVVSKAAARWGA